MKKTLILALCMAMLLTPLLDMAEDSSAQTVDVEIRFPDWEAQYEGNNMVLVAGFFQEVFIGTSGTNASLSLEYTGSGATSGNDTYHFLMNSTGWYDLDFDWYVNETMCNSTGSNITFGVGVNITAWAGEWRMIASVDGAEVFNDLITVAIPVANMGVSRLDFEFRVEPFEAAQSERINSPEYSRLFNNGNIPLSVWADWGVYEDIFEATNATGILFPGEERVDIIFYPQSRTNTQWNPQSMEVHCTLHGEAAYKVSQWVTVYLDVNFAQQLNIDVEVRLADYDILDIGLGTIVMQYKQGPITLNYEEEKLMDIYLSGTNNTVLDLSAVNVTIVKVEWNGTEYDYTQSISVPMAAGLVEHINITVRGDFSNSQGTLVYSLRNADNSVSGEGATRFQTGLKPPTDDKDSLTKNPAALIALGVGIVLFLAIIIGYQAKKKKGGKKGSKK